MKHYAAMRMSNLYLCATIWMNVTDILLSKKSQHKRVQAV